MAGTPAPERLIAALSDRYRLERELGQGGMATVYLAHDLRHDRDVAIKVLHEDLGFALGAERFLAEIRTTARLQHPHILPLLDSGSTAAPGESGGLLYYVMPYVAGESLRDRLSREKQLPIEDALRITREVADALGHAHAQGIVHRDIKPENILLQEGHALVADFGIALAVSAAGGARLTQTGLSLGTPQYMSPEQAMGERVVDARSDVYALGAVLYEMLVGEPPFTGATVAAVVAKVLGAEPAPPTTIRKTVPVHVEEAVLRALAKLPADRWGGAAEFVAGLGGAGQAAHTRTRPAPRATPALSARLLTSLRTALAIAALPLALILARSCVQERAAAVRSPRVIPLELSDPVRVRSAWASGIRMSPDGRRLAYHTGGQRHVMLDLSDGSKRPVSTEVTGLAFVFSPSGDSVAFSTTSWNQQIYIVDLATGRSVMLADSTGAIGGWGDDGWIYFEDHYLGGISRVRVADGRREGLLLPGPGGGWRASLPRPVPGGRGVVYQHRPWISWDPTLAEIRVFDLRNAESRTLTRGVEARVTASGHLLVAQSNGSLLAARFDTRALAMLGQPVEVLDSLEVLEGWPLGSAFEISDEGTLVYVRAGAIVEDSLVEVGRDGRMRSPPATWGGWIEGVARSSDGARWAVTVHRGLRTPNIWARGAGDLQARRLTFGEDLDYSPNLLADGSAVTFVSPRNLNNWDLYRVGFDGGGEPEKILDRAGDIQGPAFSRDGTWVAFCERDGVGQTDIFAHRFGRDSVTVAVAATPAYECSPDISPDGRWIAYESAESGRTEVYVRPFPDAAGGRWQVSVDGGSIPRWSTSGRELYYQGANRAVVAVPVAPASTISFGAATPLFTLDARTRWTGEVLPGDEGFLLLRQHLEAPGHVVMIQGFHEILRERLGR